VFLVAATVFWGSPIEYRQDSFTIWSAVPRDDNPDTVHLHYTCSYDGGPWTTSKPFTLIKTVNEFFLFKLEFSGRLPVEFVLVMETKEGSKFYDNNGGYGVNYKLHPHKGLATNVVVSQLDTDYKEIYVFPDIFPYKLVEKQF